MWSMTLNASELRNGSFQPARAGTMIRWPDEETGRNSVRPCTIPITIAWANVSISAAVAPGARCARCRLRARTHALQSALAHVLAGAFASNVMRDDRRCVTNE